MNTASSVVVGFAIGEKAPKTAWALTVTSVVLAFVMGGILAVLEICGRFAIAGLFPPATHAPMPHLVTLIALAVLCDGATMSGVLRGLLRLDAIVVGNITSYWIVALPV